MPPASKKKSTAKPKTAKAKAAKPKTRSKARKGLRIFEEEADGAESREESALPKDEAGRRKIKRQYENLLGIRVEKLKGRILNRERINKTIEGVYFVCAICKKVCHNMDEGLVEDPDNANNLCSACAKPARAKNKRSRRA